MEELREALPQLLFQLKDGLRNFKRDAYKTYFLNYYEKNSGTLDQIDALYESSEDKELVIHTVSDYFIDGVKANYDELTKKSAKEQFVMDQNTMLVVYVIPFILHCKKEFSTPLANEIVDKWNQTFSKYHVSIGTFEDIDGGFKRKLCYITTAVCESLGKSDDCKELEMFREYRDGYLLNQPDGKELIEQYYDIAPTIVTRINKSSEAKAVYQSIWDKYLTGCLDKISQDQNDECKIIYKQMVEDLQEEYMR